MAKHIIKCDPIPFQASLDGLKTFDTRLNDRFYQSGDEVEMREFDRKTKKYSGRRLSFTISFVSTYQMHTNWVTFGYRWINKMDNFDINEVLKSESEKDEDIPF